MQLDPADSDAAVTWTLTRAARNIERLMTAVIAESGLSTVQFGVLVQLATNGPLTRAELARLIETTPQSMAGVIEGMIDKGMLRLTATSGRGRANPVDLTPHGHAALEWVWGPWVEANRAESLGLTADEAATLNALLHRLRGL